ncbi:NADP-dependent oxidoreductase [Pseudomonas nabeulensis]|uniref:NADP-dependent oxidoreductase n=1 Tax=Pseudomonas nabeulensis TaxID=2293833 RepID=A0A4Z0AG22_9PSED|nr:NADP-dependent oxidoreductase [Pseudomonas nabeulensis]TFY85525.1 NADP-dependent oxidoreductase [Pseudomonas nabeulensis]
MPVVAREIHLKSRPSGLASRHLFSQVQTTLPALASGQVLVRNLFMSVDPYMRGRMNEGESYIAPFEVGAVMDGAAVGLVVESADSQYFVGDAVSHFSGWRDRALLDAANLTPINIERVSIQAYLGALGLPGHAAFYGLLHIAKPKAGETVFVSSAAGAVGSLVAQIAKLKGCRVIGSVGSEAKARWLRDELGVDVVINYNDEPDLEVALRRAAPEGIDVYFDNVGGAHLEAAIAVANKFARFPLCGMVGQYNSPAVGPSNIYTVIAKSLLLQGFIGINHLDTWADFTQNMSSWITEGLISTRETIVDGLDSAPEALMGLFSGDNVGKMLVRLG